jgi:ribosomal protein S15P/S13E
MAKAKTETEGENAGEVAGIEEKIAELAKKDLTSEKIGLELKKQGIFVKSALNKRIGKILKEKKHYVDADLQNIGKIVEKLKKHLLTNKHDYPSKRALLIKEASYTKLKAIKQKRG